jgi:RNA polymerase sigma factor (sigma-70 family)
MIGLSTEHMPARPPTSEFSRPVGSSPFPPTLWTIVLKAKSPASDEAHNALAALYQIYWQPVYSFLRRRGKSRHDAEDSTQSFFLHLLEHSGLDNVAREKGKFRSFLLASLRNFLSDEWEKSRAQKRGGGASTLSLNVESAEELLRVEATTAHDPEQLFDRRWATTLLDRVLARLEFEWAESGRKERFDTLKVYLSGEPDAPAYIDLAEQMGMSTGAIKVAVLRLRQRFRELLREEIGNTVATEQEIEDERRYLLSILAR